MPTIADAPMLKTYNSTRTMQLLSPDAPAEAAVAAIEQAMKNLLAAAVPMTTFTVESLSSALFSTDPRVVAHVLRHVESLDRLKEGLERAWTLGVQQDPERVWRRESVARATAMFKILEA